MLPSLGFQEIVLLAVLALVVVGPKDLPLLLRKLGRWTAKLRGMAQEFRSGFDELARQAELDELRREVDALRRTTSLHDIGREITKPLPTLEDYAGISKPPPKPAAPALETPEGPPAEAAPVEAASEPTPEAADDIEPEQAADEEDAEARERERVNAANALRSAP
ncbi:MAG: Sec-independent protein translocase protein TatB [Hyphomonadaceae bacterium]